MMHLQIDWYNEETKGFSDKESLPHCFNDSSDFKEALKFLTDYAKKMMQDGKRHGGCYCRVYLNGMVIIDDYVGEKEK